MRKSQRGLCGSSGDSCSRAVRVALSLLTIAITLGCSLLSPNKGNSKVTGAGGGDAGVTTSPGCPTGQVRCGDECVDLSANPRDCGACGAACDGASTCQSGKCQAFCGQGRLDCGGQCVTVSSDPAHCGSCDKTCPTGQYCVAGACQSNCPFELCDDGTGTLVCADTQTNASHCGGCGAACANGQSCVAGVCTLVCPDGRTACGGQCVDTASDARHCGTCTTACASGEPCINSGCGCPGGSTLCDGACVDTKSDATHCGGCATACPTGGLCSGGVCSCPTGQTACTGACVNTAGDAANCGSCGHACASTELCNQGSCRDKTTGCSSGLTLCGSSCVDTRTTATDCGGCGKSCATGQSCTAGACTCPTGQALCGSSCVDTQSNSSHCGDCATACSGGSSCSGGKCVCPTGQTLCSGVCVDMTSDEAHCGSCTTACGTGQTCVASSCQCPSGQSWCNGACVDPLTSNENCGGCNQACGGGQTCNQGTCQCPAGLTACSGTCVDLKTSGTNCGACGKTCGATQSCFNGSCAGSSGADGCSGLAYGISLTEVAAYQSTEIPIMKNMAEVVTASRNAAIVTDRETLFRVFVKRETGWVNREISARVTITNPGSGPSVYYQKATITADSVDATSSTTFQLYVPSSQITLDTTYSVELAECSGNSGTLFAPRFPTSGDLTLGTRVTGGLKIKLIPVLSNGMLPDTSAASLDIYKQMMMAMYPIDAIDMTVGDQISAAYPIDWSGLLDQMRTKRAADAPPADVYYYGLVKPTATFRDFCSSSCTTGIGYVASGTARGASQRAAVGIGFADRGSAQTMAHEVGHNHGRNHAPCVSGGTISGVDPNYPYSGGLIGVMGYDDRSQSLIPTTYSDIMGYCSNKWISDYTYEGLVDRVATVNGVTDVFTDAAALSTWRVLLLDGNVPRWGLPITAPSLASGTPEVAYIDDSKGALIAQTIVYRTEIGDIDSWMLTVPEPEPGWYAIEVSGAPPLAFNAPIAVPAP